MLLSQHHLQIRRNVVLIYVFCSESQTEWQLASHQTQPCGQPPYFPILATLLWVLVQTSQVPGSSDLAWYLKGWLSSARAKLNTGSSGLAHIGTKPSSYQAKVSSSFFFPSQSCSSSAHLWVELSNKMLLAPMSSSDSLHPYLWDKQRAEEYTNNS